MSESVSLSKNHFYLLVCILGVLVVALIYVCTREVPPIVVDPDDSNQVVINDGKQFPISPPGKKFLVSRSIKTLLLIEQDGRVRIVDEDGNNQEPCAIVKEGQIANIKGRDCKLTTTDVSNLHSIAVITRTGSEHDSCEGAGGSVYCP